MLYGGANSIFYGCKLLTTPNPDENSDMQLFKRLGIRPAQRAQKPDQVQGRSCWPRVSRQSEPSELFYDATRPRRSRPYDDAPLSPAPLPWGRPWPSVSRPPCRAAAPGGGRERRADPGRGRDYLNVSGNDYLGLAGHTAIKAAFAAGVRNMARAPAPSPW